MSKSQSFLVVNISLLIVGSLLFWYLTKPLRKLKDAKLVRIDKESGFRKEAVVLDSLYKSYVSTLPDKNPSTIAGADAALSNQIALLKKNYAGSSPPAVLASKLIRNYQFRILLNQRLLQRRNLQSDEVNRIAALVQDLDKHKRELELQNQMLQQAILNLP